MHVKHFSFRPLFFLLFRILVILKVLGIKGKLKEEKRADVTPQFMMELYHTVTDSDGKTTAKNPYNAEIVRSFIEKSKTFCLFELINSANYIKIKCGVLS